MYKRQYIWLSVKSALKIIPKFPEWIPHEIILKYKLPTFNEAVQAIHHPKNNSNISELDPSRLRFALDEIYAHQLSLFNMRKKVKQESKMPYQFAGLIFKKMLENLPFSLTDDQMKVIDEIANDLRSCHKMMRLVQGDVGAGKTLVCLLYTSRCV